MPDAKPRDVATEERSEGNCYVALTHEPLNVLEIMNRVRSPKAGAIVLFAGTTRDSFNNQPVQQLEYTSYRPKALQTMLGICAATAAKHALHGIAMVHRLGTVPIGQESVVIAVASAHRAAAWRAGEEALELCKERVEVWKREVFGVGAAGGDEDGGVWRANAGGDGGGGDNGLSGAGDGGGGGGGGDVVRPGLLVERGHGRVVHPSG